MPLVDRLLGTLLRYETGPLKEPGIPAMARSRRACSIRSALRSAIPHENREAQYLNAGFGPAPPGGSVVSPGATAFLKAEGDLMQRRRVPATAPADSKPQR